MRGMNNPLRKVIPYSARAKELSFFTQNATPGLGWPIRVWAGLKCAFLHRSMLFCAFSILLHLLPLIPWDWPVLLSKRHLYCHCLTFLFKLRFKEAVRTLFFYCNGTTLRQCVLFVCVLGANYEGKNSIIGRRTKDNFSTAKRDRALVHNVKTTPLNRSGHIFERTKTCTDPPFVFTGRAQLCNFLNGKVCKFFLASSGQNFYRYGSTCTRTPVTTWRVHCTVCAVKAWRLWQKKKFIADTGKNLYALA